MKPAQLLVLPPPVPASAMAQLHEQQMIQQQTVAEAEVVYNQEEEQSQSQLLQTIERITSEKAVVVFSSSSCFLCHAVKRLFSNLGVHPAIYEVDQQSNGPKIERSLRMLCGTSQSVPAIFIGKRYVGGLDSLIGAHISGSLVPQLKQAGALWL